MLGIEHLAFDERARAGQSVFELAFVEGKVLDPKHLLFIGPSNQPLALDQLNLGGQTLESLERAAIEQTLAKQGGNKTETARVLGISISALYEKLKKLGR